MRSITGWTASAGTFFFALALGAQGAPQVVGDEACEKHAIDIAAFATCEGDRVVKPAPAPTGERRVEASKAVASRDAASRAAVRVPPVTTSRGQSR